MAESREPYQRPRHPRFFCKKCRDYPDGFRSPHELRRHTSRFHSAVRRLWVTVDISDTPSSSVMGSDRNKPILPKVPLTGCRKCDSGKKYGANYNAAEHLRRQHFDPRARSRAGGASNDRNNIHRGGANRWPPMELLKLWIREVEEYVEQDERGETEDTNQAASLEDTPVTATSGTAPPLSLGGPSLANEGSVRPADITYPTPLR